MFSFTSFDNVFNFDIIHLSSLANFAISISSNFGNFSTPSKFINTNFAAFHNLFAKFEACSSFSGIYLMSFPAEIPKTNENLNASVLYWSITSNGSIPFPNDFDIFLPWLSLTIPCINISLNGFCFIHSNPENIILATQKNIMSYPVTNTFVG